MARHEGSCHCGRIAFEVEADFQDAITCNCSMCRRAGTILAFVPRAAMTLKTPADDVAVYRFGSRTIAHVFCPTCGIKPFGEGVAPDGTEMAAINLRCVPDVDLDALNITAHDGASA
ncbi:aldehyde-activating protein [Acuticoccus sediminis]|uniref:Aldehyde-activating protein n=1 Tax=Acuticoccus sediminis TaxID=2184697 RepID=A0A8B2NVS3_9HYPH|nr:GFA family protein [Acuticoccus sediminis]RAI04247.1 aldehyde-activating protein [Acuticoccus sediminis]